MSGKQKIFVVGYPKSGNTWLTRLLARALDIEVSRFSFDDTNPEIAADLNAEIANQEKRHIYKLHILPEEFEKSFKPEKGTKVVYIRRDIKDVLVSSFFYFKHKYPEEFVLKDMPREFLSRPGKMLRYHISRRRLRRYINNFMGRGQGESPPIEHHEKWKAYLSRRRNEIDYVETTYEVLLGDTFRELKRILQELNEAASDECIRDAVDRESFKQRRAEVANSSTELTFGKEFNLKFLRKGRPGDYKRFLTDEQISQIDKLTV